MCRSRVVLAHTPIRHRCPRNRNRAIATGKPISSVVGPGEPCPCGGAEGDLIKDS